MIKILLAWFTNQITYSINDSFSNKIDTLLNKFIMDELVTKIFHKYDNIALNTEYTIIYNRIQLIKNNIQSLSNRILFILIPTIMSICLIILNFIMINRKIGISALILLIIHMNIILQNSYSFIDESQKETERTDEFINFIGDKFNNLQIITSVENGIELELNDCKLLTCDLIKRHMKMNYNVENKRINGYISNMILFSILTYVAINEFENKRIDKVGIITIFMSYNLLFDNIYSITFFLPDIYKKFGIFSSNKVFLEELYKFNMKDGNDYIIKTGNIEFNNITFGYKQNYNIMENYNFKLINGKVYILYGPSGSGKSTFVKLIYDIIKPKNGTITLDGIDIAKISKNTIKKYIKYVPQNSNTLFSKTILENLIYGHSNTEFIIEQIKHIILKYNIYMIYTDINNYIDKNNHLAFLNYNVGKSGELLSGGQKQMIHLIRSLFTNDATVLIYDEPTSALDDHHRTLIIDMIVEHNKNKTIIIITHDEKIKNNGDEIIEFNYR